MIPYRALVVLTLAGFAAWLAWGAYLAALDLVRRWRWYRKHDAWQRRNAAYLSQWRDLHERRTET